MHCPYCRNTDTRVLDSRVSDDGSAIRRRRGNGTNEFSDFLARVARPSYGCHYI